MNTLVFSKNRAAQLDLLLHSVQRYAPWVEPTVLYTCDPSHDKSYDQLQSEHIGTARFVREYNFQAQTLTAIMREPEFMWLVDDAVFFRPVPKPRMLPYSCRVTGTHYWRHHPPDTEYGYPLAVCDSAYTTATVLPLLDFPFTNPNQLERGLHAQRDSFTPGTVYGGEQSLCTIEHNSVSADSWNPTMGGDVNDLRDRFMSGSRLRIPLIEPGSAHVQVPLVWS